MPEAAPRRMKMYRKPPACRVAQGERNPADCGTGPFSEQFLMLSSAPRRMKMPFLFKMPFLHVAAGAGRLFTGQMDMPGVPGNTAHEKGCILPVVIVHKRDR